MATTTTKAPDAKVRGVLDAMREVTSEEDRWHLAEALFALIPKGEEGFDAIIDEANKAGVLGKLSANTLRLYRDTARLWPKSSRVPGVSFSAHREAQGMIGSDGDTKRAEKMLSDLAKGGGPDKVTVASVRREAMARQGKTPKAGTRTAPKGFDVLADLEDSAKQLIAAINSIAGDGARLDKVHSTMSKALQRVEALQVKARAKSKQSTVKPTTTTTKVAPKPTPNKGTNGKQTAASKRGDLRNL